MTDTASTDPAPIPLPEGLWSQPAVNLDAVGLGETEAVRSITVPAALHYEFTPGRSMSRFLRAIEHRRIVGERCPETRKVYVPPRGMSPVCGKPTEEQVELGHSGTVTTFCIVNIDFTGNGTPVPYVSALILVDGSDIPIYGLIQEVEYDKVNMGMRVEAVWVEDEQLSTSFANIKWWRPNGEPDVPEDDLREWI